ncbi:hypothetical protein T484DRAFT_1800946 [Baffinella frigidus]|nr:hypothetical protein T484DRAFT_1800946 [Cryptophyta sp. CCMP2293]
MAKRVADPAPEDVADAGSAVQVLRAIYSSFFLAWQQRWRLSMAVKAKLKAVNLRLCLEIAAVWRAQSLSMAVRTKLEAFNLRLCAEVEVQRTLKLATLERWLVVSKSKTQMPFRRWYLWCADMNNRREAQTLIASMLAKRWAKIRIARMLQGWWGETENGAETGRGREELLNLLNEQQQMNKALEETVSRYKELHNKTEVGLRKCEDILAKREKQIVGLRKYEDILAKREKQIVRIENENNDLTMRLQASAQEVQRLKDLSDLSLREAMLRKAQLAEPNLPPSAAGDGLRISDHAPRAASRGGGERVPSPPGSTTLSSRQGSGGSLASGGSLGLVGSPVVGGAEEEGGGKVGEDGSEAVRDTASPPGGAPLTAPTPTPDPPGGKDIPPGEPPKSATPAPAPAKAPTPPPGGKAPEAAPPPDSKPAAGAGEMVKTAKAAGSIFAAAAPASAVVKQTGGAGAGAGGGKVAGLPGIARPAGAPQLSAPAPLPRIQGCVLPLRGSLLAS